VDKFLGSVESILNGCEQKTVKFLFLGRRQDSLITLRLRPLIAEGLATLELDKEAFQLDGVKIYVDQKVEELCLRRPGLRLRKDYLVKLLCDKSDGMYLLTELAIASLRSASGYDADVMAELEKIPPKIGFIYRKALDGVEAKHRITVSNLLLWMTFGLRRLTEQEMSFVLASVADSSFLKRYLDNGLQHAYFDVVGDGGVQAIVGTLVKVTETSVGPMILDLVHGTARQYLATIEQREQDTDSSVPDWFVDSIYGHLNVARFRRDSLPRPSSDLHSFAHEAIYRQCYACLDETIAHDRLRITKTSDDDRINSVLPFFSYAAENIFEHARHVSTKNTAFYLEMAANLDSRRGRMIRDHFWHSKAPEEHKDQPLIHFACELGLEGLVACLIPRTDPKCRDSTWNTPLNIAAATGIIPILKLLCESGKFRPNEHEKGPGGGTALHTAVYYGHLEATQYLMSKVTDDGVYHGYHPGTRHPLEKIYDTLQGRIDPPRPADVAAQIDNVPMLKLFQNYGCLDSRTFFEAVASGSTRTMDYLAQLPSVDLSWKNSALCKSAHVGAKSGRLSSMEWLEAHQCMTKDFESDGFQLIHLAGLRGHHRIVDVLVRRGHAGIDDPDKQGFTVLRLACREGVYETIAVAIQYGAKTRWGLASSETISALDEVLDRLHNAPERLSKTAWVLLDLVPDLRDGRWVLNTPTHMAKYAHYRVLEHLLKRRAENFRNKAPPAAPSHQDQFATRLFDVFFGSIHAVDSQGRTALHNLLIGWVSLDLGPYSETDWIASVGHLLDHGADIDIMDRYGMTALDVYIYTLTGLRDATGYPVPPDLQFSPPKFICDGVLRTLSTRPDGFPRTLFTELPQVRTVSSLLTKHRGELLLSLGRQQRKYPEDAKVLLSCFPKDELDVWMERYATADVIFLLRSAGRPDKESVPVLEKLPSKELVAILLKDFFAQGDYERLLPLSPLCQGALRRLREVDTSAIGPALAAARSKLGSSDSAQDNAALKHMQTHCLPDEIPEGFENSLLLKAVQAGDTDGVRYLVETCSADVDAALDDRRRPALSIAASYVHVPVVKYLLEHGATVQKRDNTGATALHWAARGYSEDNKDIFRLLLDHGAQITDELLADSKTNWNMSQFLRQLRETPSRPT
jgi:ankyrin repeat protein